MERLNTYCRFCAEQKNSDKMLNLNEESKSKEVHKKLSFLNAIYVDLINNNGLPKTICFICYDALDKAYEFLNTVMRSQNVLSSLFNREEYVSEDDRAYDDLLEEVKTENYLEQNMLDIKKIDVKKEPKDELNDDLNVQDIFDAAIRNIPEMTIYANEESNLKKSVSKWSNYPWTCAYCNIEFLDITTLRLHSRVTHGRCNAFTCVYCKNYDCSNFDLFINHVRKHKRKLRKRCEYCDEVFDEELLDTHVREHFKDDQLPCHLCGEIFTKDSLQDHLEEFEPIKPKRKRNRKRGAPLTIEELTCKLCNKVYKTPNSLRDHQSIHTQNRKKDYTCDRCGKTFYKKGTLTSHIMAHDQVRPHICKICNKAFIFPNMLRRHVEMHTGVKPFSCEQCGRCFRLQYQLNAHKIIHTDSMPHVCKYCNKAFRFKQILKNHERQHTGDKPYACEQCGMKFTNWSNYNKHMKRRHGMDTSKKKITPEGVFPINPQTGELVQLQDDNMEEWKTKIMIPGKRGKKKVLKDS
ncbi:zinc finger protein 506-like [Colias croceus]|uniref:zinc finger protein 506-like n=1 Tax=Colias crocea TaxID=72248 RepID=UPI001E281620|nr:zinc finger protein 506-like [Colias croceus]